MLQLASLQLPFEQTSSSFDNITHLTNLHDFLVHFDTLSSQHCQSTSSAAFPEQPSGTERPLVCSNLPQEVRDLNLSFWSTRKKHHVTSPILIIDTSHVTSTPSSLAPSWLWLTPSPFSRSQHPDSHHRLLLTIRREHISSWHLPGTSQLASSLQVGMSPLERNPHAGMTPQTIMHQRGTRE